MGKTSRSQQAETPASHPSPVLEPLERRHPGDLGRAVLACLLASGQDGYCEIGRTLGCRPSEVRRVMAALVRTGAAPEWAMMEDCDRLSRAIMAFLGEPRQVREVVAYIGRPVSAATGQLVAMRRRGLVLRNGHDRYERTEPLPGPVRQTNAAALSLSFKARAGSRQGDTDAAVQDVRSSGILQRHVA